MPQEEPTDAAVEPPTKKAKLQHDGEAVDMEESKETLTTTTLPQSDASAAAASTVAAESSAAQQCSSSVDAAAEVLTPHPSTSWSYVNKTILAPMVRIGTLPMRRLAVEYGADMVYSEELIAKKLRRCVRVERTDSEGRKFIDFIPQQHGQQPKADEPSCAESACEGAPTATASKSHNSNWKDYAVLTTYPGEPLVVQIGASNAEDALAAARVVAGDACAIDINAGCPKHFSLQGGMGAALLSKPDTLADILTTLRRNIDLPITCKIRLLSSTEATIALARRIESCGVSALAVHARHIEDRPRHRALRERIRAVADAIRIPLLYNGDCFYSHEIDTIKAETGAASVMIARGAMWNPSIFRRGGADMEPLARVVAKYMAHARELGNHFTNTKYCVMEMLKGQVGSSALFRGITRSRDMDGIDEALKQGVEQEPMLMRGGREYAVTVLLEERAAHGGGSADGAAGAAVSAVPPPPLSKKEKKYLAKQSKKNREGRKADLEAAAVAAKAKAAKNKTKESENVEDTPTVEAPAADSAVEAAQPSTTC